MNPDNYGTLPACKKLAEVLARRGRVIETEFCWFPDVNSLTGWSLNRCFGKLPSPDCIPAYSMPEVWRELPEKVMSRGMERYLLISKGLSTTDGLYEIASAVKNSTDALIELWSWVLEQEEEKP